MEDSFLFWYSLNVILRSLAVGQKSLSASLPVGAMVAERAVIGPRPVLVASAVVPAGERRCGAACGRVRQPGSRCWLHPWAPRGWGRRWQETGGPGELA